MGSGPGDHITHYSVTSVIQTTELDEIAWHEIISILRDIFRLRVLREDSPDRSFGDMKGGFRIESSSLLSKMRLYVIRAEAFSRKHRIRIEKRSIVMKTGLRFKCYD